MVRNIQSKMFLGLIVFMFSLVSSVWGQYGGGDGTAENPYQIYTAEQMNTIGYRTDHWESHFILMNDIDLSDYDGRDGREAFNIIGNPSTASFKGVFDGNHHTITGFTYESTETLYYIGIFGSVRDGIIKNLSIENPVILVSHSSHVGGLAGQIMCADVINCHVNQAEITGDNYTAGLIGTCVGGSVLECSSSGNVTGMDSCTGGLVGYCYNYNSYNLSEIDMSYSTCAVSGQIHVGGLIGLGHEGTILNSYSQGSVTGVENVGGLMGSGNTSLPAQYYMYITNCYSTGQVTGTTSVGGLIGKGSAIRAFNSFWDLQTSGQVVSSGGGVGKPTEAMMSIYTFMAWACDSCWTIEDELNYPHLAWENPPGIPITASSYSGGSGTVDDPYLISSPEDLYALGYSPCHWDMHFKLTSDIDLSEYDGLDGHPEMGMIGTDAISASYAYFRGSFDGDNYSIYGFRLHKSEGDYAGLFGYVLNGAVIKNVSLVNPYVVTETSEYTGALIGKISDSQVENCHVINGSVQGAESVGGLVGYFDESNMLGCSADVTVQGGAKTGGLIGYLYRSTLTECHSSGSIIGGDNCGGLIGYGETIYNNIIRCSSQSDVQGNNNTGGLVGYGDRLKCEQCFFNGTVIGQQYVGGFSGYFSGFITDCYASGEVTGTSVVGGLCGYCSAYVLYSYAANSVTGDPAGGFIGENVNLVFMSYWDMELSGLNTSAAGQGLTTAEMKSASTYVGWGERWSLDEDNDYPHLVWEESLGIVLTNPIYSGGSGSPEDPYLIYTAEQLNQIGLVKSHLDKHFKLMSDIDLSGYDQSNYNVIGLYYSSLRFKGVFDGNNHVISNFTYIATDENNIGIFGYVDDNTAEIKNLHVVNPNVQVDNGNTIGAIAGRAPKITNCSVEGGFVRGISIVGGLVGRGETISGCTSSGEVLGTSYVGGLAGSYAGIIENSSSQCMVTGESAVGGLVGEMDNLMTNCSASGEVIGVDSVGGLIGKAGGYSNVLYSVSQCHATGNVSGTNYVGGLIGDIYSRFEGDIEDCSAHGIVSGGNCTGGLIGRTYNYFNGNIKTCYALGNVSGEDKVGGFIGEFGGYGQCLNCYATGNVTGSEVTGGLIGNSKQPVLYCYSAGEVTGNAAGGLIGSNSSLVYLSYWDEQASGLLVSAGGEGKTTAEMKLRDTFKSWGCSGAWNLNDTIDYPRLLWEALPGTVVDNTLADYIRLGDGSENNPFIIKNADELKIIASFPCDWDKHFQLGKNLKNISEWTVIGNSFYAFSGVFDGNGYTISNFSISTDEESEGFGLFGIVSGETAAIRNLTLITPNIQAPNCDSVGAIAGSLSGSVYNCSVISGTITGRNKVGGLFGSSNFGISENCQMQDGSVTGVDYVGGLSGYTTIGSTGQFIQCSADVEVAGNNYIGVLAGRLTGNITDCVGYGSVTGNERVGGLVGELYGLIEDCAFDGAVIGSNMVGGLVGSTKGSNQNDDHGVNRCYAVGTVEGNTRVGGIAGYLEKENQIKNSYTKNIIAGIEYVGGIAGYASDLSNYYFNISNCYAVGAITGNSYVEGIVGYVEYGSDSPLLNCYWNINTTGVSSGSYGTGLTSSDMMSVDTYQYWRCGDAWVVNDGADYPRLVWENTPGEFLQKSTYGGGDGSSENPYIISTPEHFVSISYSLCDLDSCFKLMADIDLAGYEGQYHPIGINQQKLCFTGVFDGNGHSIINVCFQYDTNPNVGVIGCLGDVWASRMGYVRNVSIVDPNITVTAEATGALVGDIALGTIENCTVTGGFVQGVDSVGGLMGCAYRGNVSSCSADSISVSGNDNVGGIFGYVNKGSTSWPTNFDIVGCHASATVSGNTCIGGLAGQLGGRYTLIDSFSEGTVEGNECVGGLIGKDEGHTENCYSNSTVIGVNNVGGLIGESPGVYDCYATGSVTGIVNVGGLLGFGSCENSHATGSVAGESAVGGLVGSLKYSARLCYATGDIHGVDRVGGLIGDDSQYHSINFNIVESYSNSHVTGNNNVGGLVGYSANGSIITNCYTSGIVEGQSVIGGLVGYGGSSNLKNCYSASVVTGDTEVGGLVGQGVSDCFESFWDIDVSGQSWSAVGEGLVTSDMMNYMTYIAWSCEPVWTIDVGNDYPRLVWEEAEGIPIALPEYGGGDGTEFDPFLIYTAEELYSMQKVTCHYDKYFKLMADIDLSNYDGQQGNPAFNPIGSHHSNYTFDHPFTGVFDGNGHTISHFTYSDGNEQYIGLFGYVENDNEIAKIKNLNLVDPNIVCLQSNMVGALVGSLRYGTVEKCNVEGGTINGNSHVGGLIGYISSGGTLQESSANSKVTGGESVGGLAGSLLYTGAINNCYTRGPVSGGHYVGGLLGRYGDTGTYSATPIFSNSYSTGQAIATDGYGVGGLVGVSYKDPASIMNSFWDKEVSGRLTSAGGTGLTTAQMQTKSTYTSAGWNFTSVWEMCDGYTYPAFCREGNVCICVTPVALTFNAVIDEANPASQSISISNCVTGLMGWEIIPEVGCDWVMVSPESDTNTGEMDNVDVTVDITGLSVGTYNSLLYVSSADAPNSPQTIEVTLNITGPILYVGPSSLDFEVILGQTASQILSIQNNGDGVLDWNVTVPTECGWLSADMTSGQSTGEVDDVMLSVDTTGMDVGFYSSEITVSAADVKSNPILIPVNLHIYIEGQVHVPDEYEYVWDAIDAATAGDVVILKPGKYYAENGISAMGKPITIRSIDPTNPAVVAATIIYPYGLLAVNGEGPDTIIEGFTLTGQGVYCHQSSPTIRNCVIRDCFVRYQGAGVSLEDSDAVIDKCIIKNNIAYELSGGISCFGGNPTISNCLITNNSLCGIGSYRSNLTVRNCTIADSKALGAEESSAITIYEGGVSTIQNSILWGNHAPGGYEVILSYYDQQESPVVNVSNCDMEGGLSAVYVEPDSTLNWGDGNIDVDPCFVEPGYLHDNGTPEDETDDFWVDGDQHLKSQVGRWQWSRYIGFDSSGDGFINMADFAVMMSYWGETRNPVSVPYSEITVSPYVPADFDDSGVVDVYDLAVLLEYYLEEYPLGQWISDDLTSLCIDAGDVSSDWTGELWPHGQRINIGAYGGTAEASMSLSTAGNIADLNHDGTVDIGDLDLYAEQLLMKQVLLAEDIDRNGVVNVVDFTIIAEQWLWVE